MPPGFAKHSETVSPFSQMRSMRAETNPNSVYVKKNIDTENKFQSRTRIMSKNVEQTNYTQHPSTTKQSSEFQTLWNELQVNR